MTFGFGVGDIIKTLELANEIRTRFVDAPPQYKAISDEVTSLSSILDKVTIVLPQRDLDDKQKKQLCSIIKGCNQVLYELREILEKYQELDSDFKSGDSKSLRAKIQRGWKRLIWKPEDVAELRSRISSNISMFHIFYGGLTMKVILEIKSDLYQLHERQNYQSNRDMIAWLSPVNYHTQQDDFLRRRQKGTGKWLLNSDKFQTWLKGSKQTLFCPGIPGAGKTMISSIVIEHLETEFKSQANIGIAYLYCSYRQQHQQKTEDLLLSLLQQLAQQQSFIPVEVRKLHERHKSKQTCPSFYEIIEVLQSTIRLYSNVFIVVDALDECRFSNEVRTRFLSELFNLQANAEVSLFATARFIPDIEKEFANRTSILLEIRATKEDVQRYLNGHMSWLPPCVSKDPTLQQQIITAITEAVDGMFLLAQLYLDSLIDKTTPRMIRRALENLPNGLDALDKLYHNAMERIQGQKVGFQKVAKQVLSWIVCAKRPLTIFEMQHALAVEVGDSELGEDNLQEIEEMISVCAALVTVDQESDIVRLVHYTTQEYFERTQLIWFPEAQTVIATTCVTYLSFDAFETGLCSTVEEFKIRLRDNILYDYASRYLEYHICASSIQREDMVLDHLVLELLKNKFKVSAATQAMMAPKGYIYLGIMQIAFTGAELAAYLGLDKAILALLRNGHYPDPKDKLHHRPLSLAAQNGRKAVVKLLLATNTVDPDLKDTYGRTPLSYGAGNGHTEVVELLLTNDGVDPDSKDFRCGRTPLSWAAENGQKEVVKLLLAKDGVDPDSKDTSYGRTPLSWAAKNGHNEVVRLLLVEDIVDPDSKDPHGRTPLSWAAENGHKEVIKLLLVKDNVDPDSRDTAYGRTPLSWSVGNGYKETAELLLVRDGVDPDSKDKQGRTPLSWAAKNGHEEVIKLLLVRDSVDPDSKDTRYFRNPLSWAAERGHEEVVKLLLVKDNIDPDSKATADGRTPLSWAVGNGYKEIVELLLVRDGVDPDSEDKQGRTPLSWAAENGHEELVKLLLSKDGVDPDSKSNDSGRTPLSWAAENGHKEVVKLLLARDGVDPDSKDTNDGGTLLTFATGGGQEEVVKLLLARDGVDPDSKDRHGWTPLSWAAEHGQEEVLKLLLARDGVDPDSKDNYGWTPLSWAAINGHKEIVKLLLAEDGVDPDSKNTGYLRTPLSFAVEKGHKEVVKLLLARDSVDPDFKDNNGRTPLSRAAEHGHQEVVKLLLARDGVDPNSNDNYGWTPLSRAAKNGHEEVVKLLVAEDGADPDSKNTDCRRTPQP